MEDWRSKLDVTEMTWAVICAFSARAAHDSTVDSAKLGVIETFFAGSLTLLVHSLRVLDVTYTHALDLFWREKTELNFLDRLDGHARVVEGLEGRHDGGRWVGSIWLDYTSSI